MSIAFQRQVIQLQTIPLRVLIGFDTAVVGSISVTSGLYQVANIDWIIP